MKSLRICGVVLAVLAGFAVNMGAGIALAQDAGVKRFGEAAKVKVDDEGAIEASNAAIKTLVRQGLPVDGGLLDAPWEEIGAAQKSIHKKGDKYFIVAVKNTEEDRVLYLLLNEFGDLYAANFSGTFDGIKD